LLGYSKRLLTLWLFRFGGTVYRGLKNKLIFNALTLCAIAGGLWLVEAAIAPRTDKGEATMSGLSVPGKSHREDAEATAASAAKTDRNWLTAWNVASIWAFGLLVWWITRARKQLVIGKFDDFTGSAAGAYVPGLGVLVAVELSRLGDLFVGFDADRTIQATPEKLTRVDVGIQAESLGQFLEKAVSAEASFSLVGFRIPVGIIMGLVGRLVQGPRLVGQIHIDGEERIVTVQMLGNRGDRSWRLSERRQPNEAGKPGWQPAAALAADLATRIFAEQALEGAVRWQALAKFIEGLDAYRLSLRTGKQNKLHLHDAERRLIEAVAEDARFDLAYYNLGVVYTELGQLDAAGAAFAQAIEVNNRR